VAPGYLPLAYDTVRKAGGLCIADEVQAGFARVGSHFWGFETHGVIPDIVTMAKVHKTTTSALSLLFGLLYFLF
jgi:alanine-glyoxylate transaminase/(R)-3-amino-2-methylpropionate-pyruvate transaminase